MNDQQFGQPAERGQAYHAVMGADGMFRSEPLVPGTVIQTADGVRIFNGQEWKPVAEEVELVGIDAEVFEPLMRTQEQLRRPKPKPKWHFKSF